jgi:RNA polymerase sigma factor (sigma-70 family)
LFEALKKGDQDALEEFLPHLRARALQLAKERLRRDEQVEDVVQATLSTFWEKRDRVREPSHVLPFLFQILRHNIGNLYWRSRRGDERQLSEVGDREFARPEGQNPETETAAHELDRIVERAIETCAAEHEVWGQVLRLLRAGRSTSEVGKELGNVPRGTVHSHIFRARRRLRQILEEDYDVKV